ncbi:hypothetical protein HZA97_09840 [Candidatus Woesearchaeota archaeon]|nr:hypothetical protein [Candidatus Woesearchaeota archaeon]
MNKRVIALFVIVLFLNITLVSALPVWLEWMLKLPSITGKQVFQQQTCPSGYSPVKDNNQLIYAANCQTTDSGIMGNLYLGNNPQLYTPEGFVLAGLVDFACTPEITERTETICGPFVGNSEMGEPLSLVCQKSISCETTQQPPTTPPVETPPTTDQPIQPCSGVECPAGKILNTGTCSCECALTNAICKQNLNNNDAYADLTACSCKINETPPQTSENLCPSGGTVEALADTCEKYGSCPTPQIACGVKFTGYGSSTAFEWGPQCLDKTKITYYCGATNNEGKTAICQLENACGNNEICIQQPQENPTNVYCSAPESACPLEPGAEEPCQEKNKAISIQFPPGSEVLDKPYCDNLCQLSYCYQTSDKKITIAKSPGKEEQSRENGKAYDDSGKETGTDTETCYTCSFYSSGDFQPIACPISEVACNNNNVAQLGEECDGTDLKQKNCKDFTQSTILQPFDGGKLKCDTACDYNTNECYVCGDGSIDGPEQCDINEAGQEFGCDPGWFCGVQSGLRCQCIPPIIESTKESCQKAGVSTTLIKKDPPLAYTYTDGIKPSLEEAFNQALLETTGTLKSEGIELTNPSTDFENICFKCNIEGEAQTGDDVSRKVFADYCAPVEKVNLKTACIQEANGVTFQQKQNEDVKEETKYPNKARPEITKKEGRKLSSPKKFSNQEFSQSLNIPTSEVSSVDLNNVCWACGIPDTSYSLLGGKFSTSGQQGVTSQASLVPVRIDCPIIEKAETNCCIRKDDEGKIVERALVEGKCPEKLPIKDPTGEACKIIEKGKQVCCLVPPVPEKNIPENYVWKENSCGELKEFPEQYCNPIKRLACEICPSCDNAIGGLPQGTPSQSLLLADPKGIIGEGDEEQKQPKCGDGVRNGKEDFDPGMAVVNARKESENGARTQTICPVQEGSTGSLVTNQWDDHCKKIGLGTQFNINTCKCEGTTELSTSQSQQQIKTNCEVYKPSTEKTELPQLELLKKEYISFAPEKQIEQIPSIQSTILIQKDYVLSSDGRFKKEKTLEQIEETSKNIKPITGKFIITGFQTAEITTPKLIKTIDNVDGSKTLEFSDGSKKVLTETYSKNDLGQLVRDHFTKTVITKEGKTIQRKQLINGEIEETYPDKTVIRYKLTPDKKSQVTFQQFTNDKGKTVKLSYEYLPDSTRKRISDTDSSSAIQEPFINEKGEQEWRNKKETDAFGRTFSYDYKKTKINGEEKEVTLVKNEAGLIVEAFYDEQVQRINVDCEEKEKLNCKKPEESNYEKTDLGGGLLQFKKKIQEGEKQHEYTCKLTSTKIFSQPECLMTYEKTQLDDGTIKESIYEYQGDSTYKIIDKKDPRDVSVIKYVDGKPKTLMATSIDEEGNAVGYYVKEQQDGSQELDFFDGRTRKLSKTRETTSFTNEFGDETFLLGKNKEGKEQFKQVSSDGKTTIYYEEDSQDAEGKTKYFTSRTEIKTEKGTEVISREKTKDGLIKETRADSTGAVTILFFKEGESDPKKYQTIDECGIDSGIIETTKDQEKPETMTQPCETEEVQSQVDFTKLSDTEKDNYCKDRKSKDQQKNEESKKAKELKDICVYELKNNNYRINEIDKKDGSKEKYEYFNYESNELTKIEYTGGPRDGTYLILANAEDVKNEKGETVNDKYGSPKKLQVVLESKSLIDGQPKIYCTANLADGSKLQVEKGKGIISQYSYLNPETEKTLKNLGLIEETIIEETLIEKTLIEETPKKGPASFTTKTQVITQEKTTTTTREPLTNGNILVRAVDDDLRNSNFAHLLYEKYFNKECVGTEVIKEEQKSEETEQPKISLSAGRNQASQSSQKIAQTLLGGGKPTGPVNLGDVLGTQNPVSCVANTLKSLSEDKTETPEPKFLYQIIKPQKEEDLVLRQAFEVNGEEQITDYVYPEQKKKTSYTRVNVKEKTWTQFNEKDEAQEFLSKTEQGYQLTSYGDYGGLTKLCEKLDEKQYQNPLAEKVDMTPIQLCKEQPELCLAGSCPETYESVCGKDGITYKNECLAKIAKADIERKGECQCQDLKKLKPGTEVVCEDQKPRTTCTTDQDCNSEGTKTCGNGKEYYEKTCKEDKEGNKFCIPNPNLATICTNAECPPVQTSNNCPTGTLSKEIRYENGCFAGTQCISPGQPPIIPDSKQCPQVAIPTPITGYRIIPKFDNQGCLVNADMIGEEQITGMASEELAELQNIKLPTKETDKEKTAEASLEKPSEELNGVKDREIGDGCNQISICDNGEIYHPYLKKENSCIQNPLTICNSPIATYKTNLVKSCNDKDKDGRCDINNDNKEDAIIIRRSNDVIETVEINFGSKDNDFDNDGIPDWLDIDKYGTGKAFTKPTYSLDSPPEDRDNDKNKDVVELLLASQLFEAGQGYNFEQDKNNDLITDKEENSFSSIKNTLTSFAELIPGYLIIKAPFTLSTNLKFTPTSITGRIINGITGFFVAPPNNGGTGKLAQSQLIGGVWMANIEHAPQPYDYIMNVYDNFNKVKQPNFEAFKKYQKEYVDNIIGNLNVDLVCDKDGYKSFLETQKNSIVEQVMASVEAVKKSFEDAEKFLDSDLDIAYDKLAGINPVEDLKNKLENFQENYEKAKQEFEQTGEAYTGSKNNFKEIKNKISDKLQESNEGRKFIHAMEQSELNEVDTEKTFTSEQTALRLAQNNYNQISQSVAACNQARKEGQGSSSCEALVNKLNQATTSLNAAERQLSASQKRAQGAYQPQSQENLQAAFDKLPQKIKDQFGNTFANFMSASTQNLKATIDYINTQNFGNFWFGSTKFKPEFVSSADLLSKGTLEQVATTNRDRIVEKNIKAELINQRLDDTPENRASLRKIVENSEWYEEITNEVENAKQIQQKVQKGEKLTKEEQDFVQKTAKEENTRTKEEINKKKQEVFEKRKEEFSKAQEKLDKIQKFDFQKETNNLYQEITSDYPRKVSDLIEGLEDIRTRAQEIINNKESCPAENKDAMNQLLALLDSMIDSMERKKSDLYEFIDKHIEGKDKNAPTDPAEREKLFPAEALNAQNEKLKQYQDNANNPQATNFQKEQWNNLAQQEKQSFASIYFKLAADRMIIDAIFEQIQMLQVEPLTKLAQMLEQKMECCTQSYQPMKGTTLPKQEKIIEKPKDKELPKAPDTTGALALTLESIQCQTNLVTGMQTTSTTKRTQDDTENPPPELPTPIECPYCTCNNYIQKAAFKKGQATQTSFGPTLDEPQTPKEPPLDPGSVSNGASSRPTEPPTLQNIAAILKPGTTVAQPTTERPASIPPPTSITPKPQEIVKPIINPCVDKFKLKEASLEGVQKFEDQKLKKAAKEQNTCWKEFGDDYKGEGIQKWKENAVQAINEKLKSKGLSIDKLGSDAESTGGIKIYYGGSEVTPDEQGNIPGTFYNSEEIQKLREEQIQERMQSQTEKIRDCHVKTEAAAQVAKDVVGQDYNAQAVEKKDGTFQVQITSRDGTNGFLDENGNAIFQTPEGSAVKIGDKYVPLNKAQDGKMYTLDENGNLQAYNVDEKLGDEEKQKLSGCFNLNAIGLNYQADFNDLLAKGKIDEAIKAKINQGMMNARLNALLGDITAGINSLMDSLKAIAQVLKDQGLINEELFDMINKLSADNLDNLKTALEQLGDKIEDKTIFEEFKKTFDSLLASKTLQEANQLLEKQKGMKPCTEQKTPDCATKEEYQKIAEDLKKLVEEDKFFNKEEAMPENYKKFLQGLLVQSIFGSEGVPGLIDAMRTEIIEGIKNTSPLTELGKSLYTNLELEKAYQEILNKYGNYLSDEAKDGLTKSRDYYASEAEYAGIRLERQSEYTSLKEEKDLSLGERQFSNINEQRRTELLTKGEQITSRVEANFARQKAYSDLKTVLSEWVRGMERKGSFMDYSLKLGEIRKAIETYGGSSKEKLLSTLDQVNSKLASGSEAELTTGILDIMNSLTETNNLPSNRITDEEIQSLGVINKLTASGKDVHLADQKGNILSNDLEGSHQSIQSREKVQEQSQLYKILVAGKYQQAAEQGDWEGLTKWHNELSDANYFQEMNNKQLTILQLEQKMHNTQSAGKPGWGEWLFTSGDKLREKYSDYYNPTPREETIKGLGNEIEKQTILRDVTYEMRNMDDEHRKDHLDYLGKRTEEILKEQGEIKTKAQEARGGFFWGLISSAGSAVGLTTAPSVLEDQAKNAALETSLMEGRLEAVGSLMKNYNPQGYNEFKRELEIKALSAPKSAGFMKEFSPERAKVYSELGETYLKTLTNLETQEAGNKAINEAVSIAAKQGKTLTQQELDQAYYGGASKALSDIGQKIRMNSAEMYSSTKSYNIKDEIEKNTASTLQFLGSYASQYTTELRKLSNEGLTTNDDLLKIQNNILSTMSSLGGISEINRKAFLDLNTMQVLGTKVPRLGLMSPGGLVRYWKEGVSGLDNIGQTEVYNLGNVQDALLRATAGTADKSNINILKNAGINYEKGKIFLTQDSLNKFNNNVVQSKGINDFNSYDMNRVSQMFGFVEMIKTAASFAVGGVATKFVNEAVTGIKTANTARYFTTAEKLNRYVKYGEGLEDLTQLQRIGLKVSNEAIKIGGFAGEATAFPIGMAAGSDAVGYVATRFEDKLGGTPEGRSYTPAMDAFMKNPGEAILNSAAMLGTFKGLGKLGVAAQEYAQSKIVRNALETELGSQTAKQLLPGVMNRLRTGEAIPEFLKGAENVGTALTMTKAIPIAFEIAGMVGLESLENNYAGNSVPFYETLLRAGFTTTMMHGAAHIPSKDANQGIKASNFVRDVSSARTVRDQAYDSLQKLAGVEPSARKPFEATAGREYIDPLKQYKPEELDNLQADQLRQYQEGMNEVIKYEQLANQASTPAEKEAMRTAAENARTQATDMMGRAEATRKLAETMRETQQEGKLKTPQPVPEAKQPTSQEAQKLLKDIITPDMRKELLQRIQQEQLIQDVINNPARVTEQRILEEGLARTPQEAQKLLKDLIKQGKKARLTNNEYELARADNNLGNERYKLEVEAQKLQEKYKNGELTTSDYSRLLDLQRNYHLAEEQFYKQASRDKTGTEKAHLDIKANEAAQRASDTKIDIEALQRTSQAIGIPQIKDDKKDALSLEAIKAIKNSLDFLDLQILNKGRIVSMDVSALKEMSDATKEKISSGEQKLLAENGFKSLAEKASALRKEAEEMRTKATSENGKIIDLALSRSAMELDQRASQLEQMARNERSTESLEQERTQLEQERARLQKEMEACVG